MSHLENIENVRKLLVDHDVNGVNNGGDTPLIIAAKKGSYVLPTEHRKVIN